MGGATQPPEGQSHKSRRALTRALRECKYGTFTVNHCHSPTLRHVGVKCNLTRHPTTGSGQAAGLSLSGSLCQASCSL
jgi:hypothetical protein